MAFLTVEDLVGNIEVVVFPKDYEKNRAFLNEDSKVFVKGRVSEEDDNASKLICESIVPFEQTKCELWIQFADKNQYLQEEAKLFEMLSDSDGNDGVVVYLAKERAKKLLPANRNVHVDRKLLAALYEQFGETRVKVVEKSVEIK